MPCDPLHRAAIAQGNGNRLCPHENPSAIKLPHPGAAGGQSGQEQVVEEVLGLLWSSDEISMNF